MRTDQQWRIDRHIPIALIFAVMLQTAAATWWASGITIQVAQLERQAASTMPQGERLVKVETKVDSLIDAVNEVKAILRQRPPSAQP
jgi:type II secretory pathway component PulL